MDFLNTIKENVKKNIHIIILVLIGFIGMKLITNLDLIFSILKSAQEILWPVILGAIIAYTLNPLLMLIEKKTKLKRGLSLLLSYTIIILLILISIIYLLPSILTSLKQLTSSIPDFVSSANAMVDKYIGNDIFKSFINSSEILKTLSYGVTSLFNTFLISLVSITSSFINWILALVVSIYFLLDKEKFISGAKKSILVIFKEKIGLEILNLLNHFHNLIGAYIGARALISVLICIPATIGLLLLKSEFLILIIVMFGLTNMIPYLGPALGMIIGFTLNVFYNTSTAIWVVILFVVIQQIDANILDPKLSGTKVGINPVTCITALAIGGAIYGILGMLLAIPVAGVIKIYYMRFLNNYEKKHPYVSKHSD
ncbi:MAG: AI-2E family transporter [Clostridium sp.]